MNEIADNNGYVYRAADIWHEYDTAAGRLLVLRGAELTVHAGELVAIMGPSGSGKSTMLFILGLLLSPVSGACYAEGRNLLTADQHDRAAFRRRYLGFVFQSANLLEYTSVYDNLEFPLLYAGLPAREREDRIRESLRRVDMVDRMHHPANRLSGGEQQRAAIARALINRPRLILADEPTGQLDSALRDQLVDHFIRIAETDGTATVIVTHDPCVAARCHHVYRLDAGRLVRDKGAGA